MTRHRLFHSATPEPIEFTLTGETFRPGPDDEPTWTEDFTCVGGAPPASIAVLLSTVSIDTLGRPAYQVPALIQFVRELLVAEDVPRWLDLMQDTSKLLDSAVLADLVEWLSEEVFGRPLARRGGSPAGRSSAPTSSTPEPPRPGTVSPTSTPRTS